ncbi:MAG: zinc ribbon domain-containing protein [Gammaproteobacteria bacterium]|nr:zinc ribbon domain-containing protein [Gammaproteobacteria bacterium]MBV9621017.1 zinc ribbon domain-containing protein [Gammaproteobacteria bacterium]
MPFYEYECQACKFYSEVMQKITDAPLKRCPSCGKPALKKLVSAPVFRLKGGGWYETDFKSEQETKRNLALEKEEVKAEKPAEKPDAKADAKPDATVPAPKPAAEEKGKSALKPVPPRRKSSPRAKVSRRPRPSRPRRSRGRR